MSIYSISTTSTYVRSLTGSVFKKRKIVTCVLILNVLLQRTNTSIKIFVRT